MAKEKKETKEKDELLDFNDPKDIARYHKEKMKRTDESKKDE